MKKKKNPNLQRFGPNNGRWKGGKSKTYYRRQAGCEPNDGKLVHHLPKFKRKPKNRKVIKIPKTHDKVIVLRTTKKLSARGKHNKLHPEKGGKH